MATQAPPAEDDKEKALLGLLRWFAHQTDLGCGLSARNAFIQFTIKAMLTGESLL